MNRNKNIAGRAQAPKRVPPRDREQVGADRERTARAAVNSQRFGVGVQAIHYASTVSETPFSSASRLRLSIRHFGMLPEVFQLDTVDGVRSRDLATKLVPPSCSIICVAVIMGLIVTINVT